MKRLFKPIGVLLIGYIMLAGLIATFQRSLIYEPPSAAPVFAAQGLQGFAEITYDAADGQRQTAWHAPAPLGRPTVVIFHGNGGDLAQRATLGQYLQRKGIGVLLVSYRGYPPNAGKPTEAGINDDTLAILAWLNASGVPNDQLIVLGASLGSGPGTWLASKMAANGAPARALVLEVPLSTMAEVAQYHYWYIPVKPLLVDRFDNTSRIAGIKAPLLILAAEDDIVVPNKFAARLFDAAVQPKQYVMVKGTQHNTVLRDSIDNFDIVVKFIEEL